MNKKLITLAIAAAFAPAVAMADATVYGKVHMSVDSNSGYTTTATTKQNGTEIVSNSSRLGVKGSEDLGGGLTALYQLETTVSVGNDNTNQFGTARDSYVGLAGGFGAMLVGRLPLANQYAYDVNFFADQVGDAGNFVAANGGASRVSNAIAYASPAMSGFSALVAYVPNTAQALGVTGQPVGKSGSYTLRGAYAGGPVNVGLSYQVVDAGGVPVAGLIGTNLVAVAAATTPALAGATAASGDDLKNTALGGTYDFGMAKAGLQYVHSTLSVAAAGGSVSQNVYTLGGSFNVGSNGAVKAQYSHANAVSGTAVLGGGTQSGAKMFAVGYDYNFSKRTMGYVAYAKTTNDAASTLTVNNYGHGGSAQTGAPGAGQDPSALSIGLSHSF